MKLESQVTSKDLSMRLKNLGVPADTLYAYYGNAGIWHDAIVDMAMYKDVDDDFKKAKLLPAYTASEIGEMLPEKINKGGQYLGIYKSQYPIVNGWLIGYYFNDYQEVYEEVASTMVEAMGLMLEYLIKNNLLKL